MTHGRRPVDTPRHLPLPTTTQRLRGAAERDPGRRRCGGRPLRRWQRDQVRAYPLVGEADEAKAPRPAINAAEAERRRPQHDGLPVGPDLAGMRVAVQREPQRVTA